MTIPIGNNKVNPNPCNEAAEKANWQQTSTLFVTIEGDITNIEGDITDIYNTAFFDVDEIFENITLDGATWNSSTNTLTIETGGGGVDNFTVKCTADDSTAGYLHDEINDNATYDSDEDLLVKNQTIGGAGSNQKERLFVDFDVITGYSATGHRLLGSEDDITKLETVENWLKLILDYSAGATQQLGSQVGTVKWKSVADWLKTLPGWTGSGKKILVADEGAVEWEDLSVTLEIVAGNLRSTVNEVYDEVALSCDELVVSVDCTGGEVVYNTDYFYTLGPCTP